MAHSLGPDLFLPVCIGGYVCVSSLDNGGDGLLNLIRSFFAAVAEREGGVSEA